MPDVGDPAPDFQAVDTHNEPIRLADFAGRTLVLYFYPKDNTPGCTREACAFRDDYDAIRRLGAEIVGVSRDSVRSHESFATKHKLPFRLISDPDEVVCKAYDVISEKKLYGKIGLGVVRTTYIIGPDAVIRAKFSKVKVNGHIEQVVAALKGLAEQA